MCLGSFRSDPLFICLVVCQIVSISPRFRACAIGIDRGHGKGGIVYISVDVYQGGAGRGIHLAEVCNCLSVYLYYKLILT